MFVRVISSERAGVGKSLKKDRLCSELRNKLKLPGLDITIPIYKKIDVDSIVERLYAKLGNGFQLDVFPVIHLDIAHAVSMGPVCYSKMCPFQNPVVLVLGDPIETFSYIMYIMFSHVFKTIFNVVKVEDGLDEFLFNLIILGSIVSSKGIVWQALKNQYYIIECMSPKSKVHITQYHQSN